MTTPKTTSSDESIDNSIVDQMSPTFRRTILLSLLIVLSTIIILWWTQRRHQRLRHHGKCLLLCGIANSGKTLLFHRLTSTGGKRAFYSMLINYGTMTLDYLSSDRPIEKVHVIEIPDHSRRHHYDFYAYKTSAKAIIFVIDSTTIENDLKHVTDYLYHLLREQYFRDQHLPLLIFCNKQDLNKANHSLQSICYLLEQELTTKRKTYGSSSRFHQDKNRTNDDIGRAGKDTFEFSDVKDIRIEFVEGSALDTKKKLADKQYQDEEENNSGSSLLKVHQWIARIWFK